jgi:hypothetical protein
MTNPTGSKKSKSQTGANAGFETVEAIKEANRRKGGHFFDKATMRAFRTRLGDAVYGGRYFITSEQRPEESGRPAPRLYTVREADPDGAVRTVGDFQAYTTTAQARAAIRELLKPEPEGSDYEQRAAAFLKARYIRLTATHKADRCPLWCEDTPGHIHGDRYRVTLSKNDEEQGRARVSFDFWNSHKDMQDGKEPDAYDVLSCIASDLYAPETFEEFCSEYGYDEDSRKAERTFKATNDLNRRLRAFFTAEEIEGLQEIENPPQTNKEGTPAEYAAGAVETVKTGED